MAPIKATVRQCELALEPGHWVAAETSTDAPGCGVAKYRSRQPMWSPVALVMEKNLWSCAMRLIGALPPGCRSIAIGEDEQKLSQSLTTTACDVSFAIETWNT
jgi:hypothetical protein